MSLCPLTVTPRDPLDLASSLMQGRRVRHLPVVDDDRVIGMLSEHDLLAAVDERALPNAKRARHVAEAMTAPCITIKAHARAAEAAELLRKRHIGALPVLRDGRLAGVITATDFLHYVAST